MKEKCKSSAWVVLSLKCPLAIQRGDVKSAGEYMTLSLGLAGDVNFGVI